VPLTVTVSMLLLFSTAWVIHFLVGTPEILMTIMPGFVIGSVYTAVYVVSLAKLSKGPLKGPLKGPPQRSGQ
jgi:hypothetical protein